MEVAHKITALPGGLPEPVNTLERARIAELRRAQVAAPVAEMDRWLTRVVKEYPGILLDDDITQSFGAMTGHGPAAYQALSRIAESHPNAATRFQAECAILYEKMELAELLALYRRRAAAPPRKDAPFVGGLEDAEVPGGAAQLNAIDSEALAREIEERLRKLADRANGVSLSGPVFFHVPMDGPTRRQFHAGMETLLRRMADGHHDPRTRTAARRWLALYLDGIVKVKGELDDNYWTTRLGAARVAQIGQMDQERLDDEVSELAEQVAAEIKQAGDPPDPKIEALRKKFGTQEDK
jgi:hypothetical protein